MLIEQRYDERIWGGHNLVERLGKSAPRDKKIGESWEVYDENRVSNGLYAGQTIADLRSKMGSDLMGHVPAETTFPLLTKLLDAQDVLSVQVHPDDEEAQRLEHQSQGKTECWYVIHAEPAAEIIYGFSRDTTPDEYERLVASGELNGILRSLLVRDGDVIYLPARTLHAIGAGIIVYELQQTSDVTYRIYDWNRRDANGQTRELHLEKAKQVLDFHGFSRGPIRPLVQSDGRRAILIAGPYFTEEMIATREPVEISTYGSPVAICALENPVAVAAAEETVALAPYSSLLVPAAAGAYSVSPNSPGDRARCLIAYVPESKEATRQELVSRGFAAEEVGIFLRQFDPVRE